MAASWMDEDRYWRQEYHLRPYAAGRSYEQLQDGYRFGVDAAGRYPGRRWEEVEPQLANDWARYPHRSDSTWDQLKDAVRDAWDRVVVSTFPTM